MADQALEENVLLVLFDGRAKSVDVVYEEVTNLRGSASRSRDDVRAVMEELRKNGYIAEAGSRDVDGTPLQAPEWALTETGKRHKYKLDNPYGAWVERIPLVGKPLNAAAQTILSRTQDFFRRRGRTGKN